MQDVVLWVASDRPQAVLEPGEETVQLAASGRAGEVYEGGRRRREENGLACSVYRGLVI